MEPFDKDHILCDVCHDAWARWETLRDMPDGADMAYVCDECAEKILGEGPGE